MANPVIGNSLFALVLALMHAPPMFALLWTQRRLRRRVARTAERRQPPNPQVREPWRMPRWVPVPLTRHP